jgi:hypothetical protein
MEAVAFHYRVEATHKIHRAQDSKGLLKFSQGIPGQSVDLSDGERPSRVAEEEENFLLQIPLREYRRLRTHVLTSRAVRKDRGGCGLDDGVVCHLALPLLAWHCAVQTGEQRPQQARVPAPAGGKEGNSAT